MRFIRIDSVSGYGRFLRRLTLIALSLFLILLALEASLRLAGWIYRRARLSAGPRKSSGEVVLCVGDSFTFGVGAPRGLSYPSQLQAMLKKSPGDPPYAVYNEGVPGMNSSQVLEELPGLLRKYRPAVVFILVGCNDGNQLVGSDLYLFERPNALWKRWALEGLRWAYETRLFKLGRAAFAALEGARVGGLGSKLGRHYKMAESYFRRSRKEKNRALIEKALSEVEMSYRLHPDSSHVLQLRLLIRREVGLDPPPDDDAWRESLRHNLEEAVQEVQAWGAEVVLLGYPGARQGVRRGVCERLGCTYVDLYSLFKKTLGRKDPKSLFSGDFEPIKTSHPNGAGYRLMAREAARVLAAGNIGRAVRRD